ncbi:MAG: 50S ribosomal protein L24 [Pseudomonadota bacterium]
MAAKIRKGDQVVVLNGPYKGADGEVLKVFPADARVLVRGVNMVKRHTKPSAAGGGGIVNKEAPLHVSNVALKDPSTGGPTRVGFKILDDGRKVRFAKKSGEVIDG